MSDQEEVDLTGRLRVLDDAECIRRIESVPLGRIGFMAEGRPLVLPVNYVWYDGSVVFRTLEGQKLAAAAREQDVCFEIDEWDHTEHTGWSVVMIGRARQVTEWAEIEELERAGVVPWTRGEWRPLWIRVDADDLSGREIT